MTRVIHTGDTHVGYEQYHSPERRQDFLDAFRQVIDDAIADDVDAVVHAGDLFHDRRPGLGDLQGTVSILRELASADIPFLAVVGNHEGTRDGQWLDLFEDLGLATRLGREPHVLDDTAFYGLDFVPRSKRGDLDYEFAETDADHRLLVSHGLFEPFAHADWDTERLLAESTVDFDAVLLGDNHAPGTREVDDTWVTYCGSTERASASEREDRGYNIVTTDDEVSISRRGLPTRDFAFVDVELGRGEGVERVREQVRQHDLDDAVAVVRLEGEGEDVTVAAVEEFATEQGALVARVNDVRDREDDDGEVTASFRDPDEAVRERVRDLGLSEAARDIDETVRADGVAKSNVREKVEGRVQTLLDEEPEAFETTSGESDDDGADGVDEGGTDGADAGGDDDADADDTETDDAETDDAETDDAETDDADEGETADDRAPQDQASMGDFA